ncbi:enoyl-coa delta isomerase 1 [Quercus suber]|uniref:Enoyl-coa delta isomerase 1 n=1 Tax=Quercus suber TaxID=58331 RepID=A0AAW0KG11_QUESU
MRNDLAEYRELVLNRVEELAAVMDDQNQLDTVLNLVIPKSIWLKSDTIASSSALITTAQGKFFSNGYDLAWASTSKAQRELMNSKLQSLITNLISLPIHTVTVVSGHASAASFILTLSLDYILMQSDRGFLYMSELDIKLVITPWFIALVECKIGSLVASRHIDGS